MLNALENTVYLAAAVVLTFALATVVLLLRAILRRRRERAAAPEVRAIDVAALGSHGPPADGPRLEVYNVPVRLVAVVIAPVGRGGTLPSNDQLSEWIERITPHMMQVLEAHQPLFQRWPPQLSTRGFAQVLFRNAPLPGDRHQGTPWCSVAGKVQKGEQAFLVGLICCADAAHNVGQVVLERSHQWLDVVRVRPA